MATKTFQSIEELRDAMCRKWPGRTICVNAYAWRHCRRERGKARSETTYSFTIFVKGCEPIIIADGGDLRSLKEVWYRALQEMKRVEEANEPVLAVAEQS